MQQRGEPCPREIPCTESLSYHNYRARAIGKEEKQCRFMQVCQTYISQRTRKEKARKEFS